MDEYSPNPPWVAALLKKHGRELSDVAGSSWVPAPTDVEYGCGHYGCVLPTPDSKVVLKITSDPSEAALVSIVLEHKLQHPGLIEYYRIVALPEKYRRRPTYAIWRADAQNVGVIGYKSFISGYPKKYVDRYGAAAIGDFSRSLIHALDAAKTVRQKVVSSSNRSALLAKSKSFADWAWRSFSDGVVPSKAWQPPRLVAYFLRKFEVIAEYMANDACGYLVGQAFEHFLEHGILLADVHLNNIGEATPDDYSSWELVITDPGHMVALEERWASVEVPSL